MRELRTNVSNEGTDGARGRVPSRATVACQSGSQRREGAKGGRRKDRNILKERSDTVCDTSESDRRGGAEDV